MTARPIRVIAFSSEPRGRRRERGFTLLELLIAVTLMSVLALMSWRALDALIDARERITRAGDELRELVVVFAQLEDDLRRAWPVRLVETGRAPVIVSLAPGNRDTIADGGQLDLIRELPAVSSLASSGSVVSDPARLTGLQQVVWRLERGRLERGFAPWWPAGASAAMDSSTLHSGSLNPTTWQPLAEQIDAIGWRVYLPGRGWFAAGQRFEPGGAAITGVELSLVRRGERIIRVFSVRD
ncbi:MAG: prepilin-type N-terminal cleavage/methylation domain-containing protein [Betaproteobacteria bacterium]|nr:prepilin-type N-terminal cleavage/methylation domain-containing protein [Betaproteobacteria bacterium]